MARKPLNVVEHLISKTEEEKPKKKKSLSSMIPEDADFPDDLFSSPPEIEPIEEPAEDLTRTSHTTEHTLQTTTEADKMDDDLIPIAHLLTALRTPATNWSKTSHGVCRGAEHVLKTLISATEGDTFRPKLQMGQVWNIAMIALGEILNQLPEGWQEELAKFSDNQEALCRRLLQMTIETLRSNK